MAISSRDPDTPIALHTAIYVVGFSAYQAYPRESSSETNKKQGRFFALAENFRLW